MARGRWQRLVWAATAVLMVMTALTHAGVVSVHNSGGGGADERPWSVAVGDASAKTAIVDLNRNINSKGAGDAESGNPIYTQYLEVSKQLTAAALTTTNFSKLEYLCDTFGPRYCGTANLERALDWILATMAQEGLANVRGEAVDGITNWQRGEERLEMLEPRQQKRALLGLGNSVGTGPQGIEADAFVVSSFDDLTLNASKAKGKIIVFNAPFVIYGETVAYRVGGADAAAAVGGVAALVRSITPYSLYTTHTGSMHYNGRVPKVPTAAITVEDSEMFARMQKRGQRIRLRLYMEAKTLAPVTSRNVLAEVVGASDPQGIVLIGGHTDSWDVGQGAMDDGAGFFSAWEAVNIINRLVASGTIKRPRRTIRAIGWVNEELGARGAVVYKEKHLQELKYHQLAVESDTGNFKPIGFGFTGTPGALDIMRNISALLTPIGADHISPGDGADTDNGPLIDAGVPGGSLESDGYKDYYFHYHHSEADTITALDQDGVRKSVAAFAILAYVAADIPQSMRK